MKKLLAASFLLTLVAILTACVAADNGVRKDYDPPEYHHGHVWN